MPVGIVDALERVQVGHDNPERKAMASCTVELPGGPCLNRPAVGQAGQGIRERELFQLTILGFYLAMKIYNPASYTNASQKFLRVKRFGEVIVCARGQATDD